MIYVLERSEESKIMDFSENRISKKMIEKERNGQFERTVINLGGVHLHTSR